MSTDGAWWLPPEPTPSQSSQPSPSRWERLKRALAPLAGLAALLVKLKSVLFLGSLAVSLAAYAQLWGWRFGAGFAVLLLVHELGHVIALRLRGIRASGLVFIPLLGAFTSWKPQERPAHHDAETALAGPIAGTVGALAALGYADASGSDLWRALAFTGFLLNLFNLIPLVPLDGGRVANLVYPWAWGVIGVGLVGYLIVRPEPLVVIILLLVGYELYTQLRNPDAAARAATPPEQRLRLTWAYLALVVVIVVCMHATYAERHLR
ncbi:MAG TPA: site-2 protease family protein [Mycobacteriales bacterium]|nr:site-2 protease family protein [Mycobacteriales bacterium]